jgi:hypothetical protein
MNRKRKHGRLGDMSMEKPAFRVPCRKQKHVTRESAVAQKHSLLALDKKRKIKSRYIHEYFCTTCNAWHVGHDLPINRKQKFTKKKGPAGL